ncbi:hypothetical protein E5S69_01880 [Cupriavidus necator]|uniref:hypothetical protein n=1 Tax=Cupriavidus necator TaxID=106590 RepID=UPI00148F92F3|nr:hypothetical protein [Cupriavidus necator]NOV22281.1 hypothetical protein [Cupriavidus necator]
MKEGEYAGWLTRYKLNRPLREYEVAEYLDSKQLASILPPNDHGVLAMNSTFVEYVDRQTLPAARSGGHGSNTICCHGSGIRRSYRINDVHTSGGWHSAGCSFHRCRLDISHRAVGVYALRNQIHLAQRLLLLHPLPNPLQQQEQDGLRLPAQRSGRCADRTLGRAYFYVGRSRPAAGSESHYTFDLRCNVLDDQRMVRDTFAVGMDGSTSRGAVTRCEDGP